MKHTLILMCLIAAIPTATQAQIAIMGPLAHDEEATAGSRYSGTVDIRNNGTVERQAKIYQTDYSFTFDGVSHFDTPGTVARSNADWIVFSPSLVTIPPGETATVSYEVTVPPDSTNSIAGSYWSILMVEDIPAGSPESTIQSNRDEIKVGVREVFRYAVQLATHVRRDERYNIDFVDVSLDANAGEGAALTVAVANSGNTFVRPDIWIEVFDAEGTKRAKLEGKPARLYPDTSISHIFDMSQFEIGEYEVLVVVDAGDENVFGAQYTVTF